MDLQVEGRHFEVTGAIHSHVVEKLTKLEKYFDGIHRMHVILSVEKTKRQTCELVCTVAKRHTLFSKGEAEDMYVAIDKAEKKILAEMKKYKAKLHPKTRGSKNKQALEALSPVGGDDTDESED